MQIVNLGFPISKKFVSIERLSKDQNGEPSYVILGTPTLDRNEIYELIGVLKHEINHRDYQLNSKAKQRLHDKKGN